jgi:hypothetical protein
LVEVRIVLNANGVPAVTADLSRYGIMLPRVKTLQPGIYLTEA